MGWNWRAYLAYVVGLAPNFYGFLDNMGVGIVSPLGVTRAYYCRCFSEFGWIGLRGWSADL